MTLANTHALMPVQKGLCMDDIDYRTLLDGLEHAVIAVADLSFIAYANPACEDLLGWPRSTLAGQPVAVLQPPAVTHAARSIGFHVYAQGAGPEQVGRAIHLPALRRDGSEIDLEFTLASATHDAGRRVVAGALRPAGAPRATDVPDLGFTVGAERLDETSLALIDTLFDTAPVGLAFMDTDLRCVRINQSLANMHGLPIEAHLGRRASEVCPYGEEANSLRRQVLMTGEALTGIEMSEQTPIQHGSQRHWLVDYYPVKSAANAVLGVGTVVTEITERKNTEGALQAERSFLHAVLHNLKDGVVACDTDGHVTVLNPASRALFGLPAEPVPIERWSEYFNAFRADGVTPITKADIPVFRALAGEEVRDVELVIAPKGQDPRVVLVNGQAFYDDEGRKLGAVATKHDITESKQAEARLKREALHDPLTGLPNRRLFLDRLHQALNRAQRRPSSVALLFLDVDRLKFINDTLGHDAGDRALIALADRLREAVRGADTLARLSGDEFVVLCEDLAEDTEAVALSDRIQTAVAQACLPNTQGAELRMTTSVGIAIARGGEQAEDLLRNADVAMYEAKRHGRGCHAIFNDTLLVQTRGRLRAESALRRAIDDKGLRLLYQPIIELHTGRLVGTEALVRYYDPARGLVEPSEFLDVAEDMGLIAPLGEWVLGEACAQMRRWQGTNDAFSMSVNLSTRQLRDSNLLNVVEAALTRENLSARKLCLEITESVLMEAAPHTQQHLQGLKEAGVRLGIDDFGTGYSSLTYLRRLPVDFLKIDRSFVQGLGADPEDTAIVTSVVNLGNSLGLTTIAEGVETAVQLAMLRNLKCDWAQGYYFAPPQSAEGFMNLLANRPIWRH